MEGLFGSGGIAKITLENLRAAREHLARLAIGLGFIQILRVGNAHLRIREGHTHIAGAVLAVHGIGRKYRGSLRHAEALHQPAAGHGLPALHNL